MNSAILVELNGRTRNQHVPAHSGMSATSYVNSHDKSSPLYVSNHNEYLNKCSSPLCDDKCSPIYVSSHYMDSLLYMNNNDRHSLDVNIHGRYGDDMKMTTMKI
jgi:hypothetical protein